MKKEEQEEEFRLALKKAAEERAKMTKEELKELRETSIRFAEKVRDQIVGGYEMEQRLKKKNSAEEE